MEVATLAVAAQELASQEPQEPVSQELLAPQDLALALAQLASMAQALDPHLASTAQEQLDRELFVIRTLTKLLCRDVILDVSKSRFLSSIVLTICILHGITIGNIIVIRRDINKRCQTKSAVELRLVGEENELQFWQGAVCKNT